MTNIDPDTGFYTEQAFKDYVKVRHPHAMRANDGDHGADTVDVSSVTLGHLLELCTIGKLLGVVPEDQVQAVIGSSWMATGQTVEDAVDRKALPDTVPQRIDDLTMMAWLATTVVMTLGAAGEIPDLQRSLGEIQPLIEAHTESIDAARLAAGEVTQAELDAEYADAERIVDALFS